MRYEAVRELQRRGYTFKEGAWHAPAKVPVPEPGGNIEKGAIAELTALHAAVFNYLFGSWASHGSTRRDLNLARDNAERFLRAVGAPL